MIGVDHPLWLLGLLAVPLVLWLGRRTSGAVRPRQHRLATAARAAAVGLLVLAIAGPRWAQPGRAVDVAFLIDDSDSARTASDYATSWIADAVGAMRPEDRAALALFGRDARIEHTLREDPPLVDLATVVDGAGTDIERALRLGQGVLGSEHRRRVVLFTDGRPTSGDAVRAAEELAASGVAVDVVPIAGGRAADVLVASVAAPGRVREGEAYEVVATVRNTSAEDVPAVLALVADGTEIERRELTVPPGDTEVSFSQVADRSGSVRFEVRLASGASTVPENDVARTAVQVAGPPRVLVYEGRDGDGDDLSRALDAAGVDNDLLGADRSRFPSLDRLLDYDSVVLVDVPASVLGEGGMIALDAFVRDAGHGLVAVGGPESFGMGGYDATVLEELLPVFARVKDPKRRPSVAEALVVDVSGSMAACHCREDGFGGGPRQEEGGVNKTDITREAVARAVRALEQQDTVGVLAFNATAEWVVPLQQLPDEALVDDALARLHPDGETDVVTALREAIAGLKSAEARLRHIVLFTDGFSDNPEMVAAAREAAEAGITLSVVATGEGTGEVLRRMAEAGGGRFYPGRDLFSIPDIIVSEVQFAARPIINEGSFLPVVSGIAPATDGLESSPPLLGYLATTEKPTARTLLRIGEERDPLLAEWQAGLGRTVAWTSDATARWSSGWVTWDRYAAFWSDVVRSTLPEDSDPRFALTATATSDGLEVTLDAADAVPGDASGTVTVTTPDGTREELELTRTGLSTFEARLPGGVDGVYAVAARLRRGDTDLYRDAVTAIRSYSPEYAMEDADPAFLERLSTAGGGRLDPAPETAFLATGLLPGSSTVPLWPLLALLALVLLPTDVGLRRLRLERGDLAAAAAWARGRLRRRRPEGTGRSEQAEGLFAARERARRGMASPAPGPEAPPDTAPAAPTVSAPGEPRAAARAPDAASDERHAPPADRDPSEDADDGSTSASALLRARRRARGDGADPDDVR
jgi:Mg-chelatase subunit ChlD